MKRKIKTTLILSGLIVYFTNSVRLRRLSEESEIDDERTKQNGRELTPVHFIYPTPLFPFNTRESQVYSSARPRQKDYATLNLYG